MPRPYIPVGGKLAIMLTLTALWGGLSLYLALPWLRDLAALSNWFVAGFVVMGLALIPGTANAFMLSGLLLDWRPKLKKFDQLPPVSVLIAAYNEEGSIRASLESFARQRYPGEIQILVIDDGSKDRTPDIVRDCIATLKRPEGQTLCLLEMPRNGGKAAALNHGLKQVSNDLVITVDADTLLFRDALRNLVSNHLQSPPRTAATAGTVLVRNSRKNLLTRLQEWDYFLGIAVVKRVQSLLQGTLVAQGAFSIYKSSVLREVGGWQETVGEDIVLTWAILNKGYRVGYAENAFVFTDVPETYGAYYQQRKRWSRGLVEAFKRYPGLLTSRRMHTPFIWFNLMFPYIDTIYLLVFIPGLIAALFFHYYVIVGLLTLLLIPMATVINLAMYDRQRAIFRLYGLRVRKNYLGAAVFTLVYQMYLAPASLMGYMSEMLNLRKKW